MVLAQLRTLFSPPAQKREAAALYIALVQQSRNPFLYEACGVADTLDGRFDLILLHMFLALRFIGGAPPPVSLYETSPAGSSPESANADSLLLRVPTREQEELSRLLLERLFDDMDQNLRQMGLGDTGISKRIKVMSKAVLGRLEAYKQVFGDESAFAEALKRNVYRGVVEPKQLAALLQYVRSYEPHKNSKLSPSLSTLY